MLTQPTPEIDDERSRPGEGVDAELGRLRELHDEVGRRIAELERLETRRPAVVTVPATSGRGTVRPRHEPRTPAAAPPRAPLPPREPVVPVAPVEPEVAEAPADLTARRALLAVEVVAYAAIVVGLLIYFLR